MITNLHISPSNRPESPNETIWGNSFGKGIFSISSKDSSAFAVLPSENERSLTILFAFSEDILGSLSKFWSHR